MYSILPIDATYFFNITEKIRHSTYILMEYLSKRDIRVF